jgi:hypothetical protein
MGNSTTSYNNKKEAGRMLRGINNAYQGGRRIHNQPSVRPAYDPKLGTPNIFNYQEMLKKMNR